MEAIVDKETCIGCGLCVSIAEDIFDMDTDGKACVIVSEVPKESEDIAKEAEASCPVIAISVK